MKKKKAGISSNVRAQKEMKLSSSQRNLLKLFNQNRPPWLSGDQ
jgi:hypothetical protein